MRGICVNKSNFAHPLTNVIQPFTDARAMQFGWDEQKKIRNPSNLDMVKTEKIDGMLRCSASDHIYFVRDSWIVKSERTDENEHKSKRHPIVLVMRTQSHTHRDRRNGAEQQKCRSSIRFNHCACPILMFSRVFGRCFWVYAIFNDKSTVSARTIV